MMSHHLNNVCIFTKIFYARSKIPTLKRFTTSSIQSIISNFKKENGDFMRTKALYPGTFDPITCGHVDIIKRGLMMFDEIVVAVARNIRKNPIFSIDERIEMIKQSFEGESRVSVVTLEDGLLVDFAISQGIHTVLRGLRAMSDFEYEFQMASMNRRLSDRVDYVFLMTSEENFFVSSSLIREVAINQGQVEGFVPAPVAIRLREKFKKNPS